MDGTGDLFGPLVRELPADLRPVIVRYPVDRWLDDEALLAFVRAALPREQPFVLLGESFSGPVALRIAAEKPVGLRAVAMCASFARYPNRMLAPFKGVAAWLPMHSMPMTVMSALLLGRFATPALQAALRASLARVAPAVLAKRGSQVLAFDALDAVSQIRVPLLCLRATRDRVVSAGATREIERRSGDCRVIDIEAPHMLLQCSPKEAAAAIAQLALEQRGRGASN